MPPDYFDALGLPRSLSLDLKDLEKRFYARSRHLHPDLFARKSQTERDKALEDSAVLNDAYRALKDPVTRALYLLKIEGFDVGEQGAKDVPPELLEEVFELNMAIEEADAQQLEASRNRFEALREEVDREMASKFAEWDASREKSTLSGIRGLLNRRKYITNLIGKTHVSDRV
ncbi:MAG: Fe-S protein assembly co-chaperone HscB [Acidobacteriota bacterium]|nr:Fe-S protein assembly co-chaperone HscB [Acidobacteriota bacterium]